MRALITPLSVLLSALIVFSLGLTLTGQLNGLFQTYQAHALTGESYFATAASVFIVATFFIWLVRILGNQ